MKETVEGTTQIVHETAVGDVYASLYKKDVYAPFSAKRRSRTLFWL